MYFAVRWEKSCLVYVTKDQQLYCKYELDNWLYSIDFSPCGKYLALGLMDMVQVVILEKTPSGEKINLECQTHHELRKITHHPQWIDCEKIVGRWKKEIRVWKPKNLNNKN